MSNDRKLGDIDLKDYMRIVRQARPFRWMRALVIAGACVLAFGAGVLTPWKGKDADLLSLRDGLLLLQKEPEEEWMTEQGLYAVYTHTRDILGELKRVAQSEGQSGKDASLYLFHLTRWGVTIMRDLAADSPHVDVHQTNLQVIREDLEPK